jgi:hypothetical protein
VQVCVLLLFSVCCCCSVCGRERARVKMNAGVQVCVLLLFSVWQRARKSKDERSSAEADVRAAR